MKTETRINYVTDCCKKRYLSKACAEKHEKQCVKNLDRTCRLCGRSDNRKLLKEFQLLMGRFDDNNRGVTLLAFQNRQKQGEKLAFDLCDNCPSCAVTLSVHSNGVFYVGRLKEKVSEYLYG